jgi:hypothetical protein
MERVYIGYFISFLLVLLVAVLAGIFVGEFRKNFHARDDRATRLRREEQVRAERERAFQDKYGR